MTNDNYPQDQSKTSVFGIIVHSFFVIPFLIAVFCILLFAAITLLTREQQTAYDFIEDIKVGGLSKRWQAAFELSKILSNPDLIPSEERFLSEMVSAFKASETDDQRVRQYLALAMGRSGKKEFVQPLVEALNEETFENLAVYIYSLGTLKDSAAIPKLYPFLSHSNARIRSITVVAIGNIGDRETVEMLKKSLHDPEPNVQWGTAISLAQMGDPSGQEILLNLLNRSYLGSYPEIDQNEQNQIILTALEAASKINSELLNQRIFELSQIEKNMKVKALALDILSASHSRTKNP